MSDQRLPFSAVRAPADRAAKETDITHEAGFIFFFLEDGRIRCVVVKLQSPLPEFLHEALRKAQKAFDFIGILLVETEIGVVH